MGGSGVPGGQRSHSATSAVFRKVLAVGRLEFVRRNGDFQRVRAIGEFRRANRGVRGGERYKRQRDGECCDGLHWSDPFFIDSGVIVEMTYPIYFNIMSTDISIFFAEIDDSHELVNI